MNINQLSDNDYGKLLAPLWNFLAVYDSLEKSDVIFVFGGLDLKVPAWAAKLYNDGWASKILVTGNVGSINKGVFNEPESLVFKSVMIKNGVPESEISTETQATNALENVLLGMKALKNLKMNMKKMILIAKPFMMRRCKATFEKHYPNIRIFCSPPPGDALSFLDRSRESFAKRLPAEIERLSEYSAKGDIAQVEIPKDIKDAVFKINQFLDSAENGR